MEKVTSKQRNVQFVKLTSPFTIDKTADWGEGNFQEFPNGGFLKMSNPTDVSHGVQPNEDFSAPLGWEPAEKEGLYNKKDIFVEADIIYPSEEGEETKVVTMDTADGVISYEVKEPCIITYNCLPNGEVNYEDGWVQTVKNVQKNYNWLAY